MACFAFLVYREGYCGGDDNFANCLLVEDGLLGYLSVVADVLVEGIEIVIMYICIWLCMGYFVCEYGSNLHDVACGTSGWCV